MSDERTLITSGTDNIRIGAPALVSTYEPNTACGAPALMFNDDTIPNVAPGRCPKCNRTTSMATGCECTREGE